MNKKFQFIERGNTKEPIIEFSHKPDKEVLKTIKTHYLGYESWICVYKNHVLCQAIEEDEYRVFVPIMFVSKVSCDSWIENGTLKEIKEKHKNQPIGFSNKMIEKIR